jgi:hypothetical protein
MGFLKTPRFSYGDSENIWVVFNVYVMEYEADAACFTILSRGISESYANRKRHALLVPGKSTAIP